MSDPTGGELSPANTPQPSQPSSTPTSTPTFEQRRASQSPPSAPRERGPSAPNPRAARSAHWSDPGTGEGQYLKAARARRSETPSTTSAAPAPDAAPGETQPAAGEEARHKFGEVELTETEIRDLMQFKATQDSRRATLPQRPDDYEFKVSDKFQVPQGIELKLNDKDPALPLARQLMHDIDQGKIGGQEAFSRMVEIYAASQIGREQALNEALQVEVQKLGASGTPRVTAIGNFIRGAVGDQLAAPLINSIVSETAVRAWEGILRHVSGQGVGTFSQAHREPPAANGKIPGYENMDFMQRRAAQDALKRK
jgi:hypothetical protein